MRMTAACCTAILIAAGLASPAAAAEATPIQIDVGLAAGTDAGTVVDTLRKSVPVTDTDPVTGLDAITVDVAADRADTALAVLKGTAGVRYAELSGLVFANGEAGAADEIDFGPSYLDVAPAWTWTTGSPDITVAVLDTGVSANPDLLSARLTAGYDFVDDDTDASDGSRHGTLLAGAVAGDRDNGVGAAGVCPVCRVMPVRVLHENPPGGSPSGTTADLAAGLVWAAGHGARIINVSAATYARSRLLEEAVRFADGKGALVVASSGHIVTNPRHKPDRFSRVYPAAFESVLAVDALHGYAKNTADDRWVDVEAYPSVDALGPDGTEQWTYGGSVSAALVSGTAALALATKPDATPAEVHAAMTSTGYYFNDYERTGLRAPKVSAARVVHAFGAADDVPPVVNATGLTAGRLIPARGVIVQPDVTDDRGVDRYEVIVGGEVVLTDKVLPDQRAVEIVPPAGSNGPLAVTLRAYDFGGGFDEATTEIVADTTLPTGTVVSPAANEVINAERVDVTVEIPHADVVSVRQYSGGNSAFTQVPGTDLWKGNIPLYPAGHVDVEVVDRAGNTAVLERRVRVDREPPAGGSITPAYATRVRGTFTSTLTGVTDVGGVAKAELWANGKYVGKDTTAPYSLAVKTGTANGNVMLTWRVTDRFGLWRNVPNRLVVADNRAPAVAVTKAPKNRAKVKGTVKVAVQASDTSGISRVELIVNGKVVARDTTAGYLLSVNTKKQKKTMTVRVRAYDRVGNVAWTSTRTWYRK